MRPLQHTAWPALGAGLVLGVLSLAGCGSSGSGGSSDAVGAANPGTVSIQLADAPVAGVDQVNVTFTKVEAFYDGEVDSRTEVNDPKADSGDGDENDDNNDQWVTLTDKPVTVNLLDLANKPVSQLFSLTNVNVPSGHYKKFRFTIGTVDLVVNGTHVTPVVDNNTVVVKSHCFVHGRRHKTLVLDFSVARSLSSDGTTYHFDPKLRLRPQEHAGMVMGTVQFQPATPLQKFEAEVQLLDAANQVVAEGEVHVKATQPQASAQATFYLHAVPPGTYSLKVVGDDTFEGSTSTPVSVTVAAGQDVQAGTVTLTK